MARLRKKQPINDIPYHAQTLDGKTHTINVESYKTVLEAALDEGIDMPHDCKLGTCLVSQPPSRGAVIVVIIAMFSDKSTTRG